MHFTCILHRASHFHDFTLKITLESLTLGADNSTDSSLLLPLFQMLLRYKKIYMHFTCIIPSASNFHVFNSCRYFGRLTKHLGITESRCCQINNFLYSFAVISNALKKLNENICISHVSYRALVIFMTIVMSMFWEAYKTHWNHC